MSLRDLYQEMILDHGRAPRNLGVLPQPSHCHAGHNPLCGDKLTVYLNEQDGVLHDIKFEGAGCAISMASASLMTETVKGKTTNEITELFDSFHQLVTSGSTENELGKLAIFAGVAEYPIRVKCATLAWHTMKAALENETNTASTE